jgi:hypothetical protein
MSQLGAIAVLGWGSLIWSPRNLRIKTKWRPRGPALPIEFARIAQDGRLTLAIHLGSEDQPTYWALSEFPSVSQARENLRARENSSIADIHYIEQTGASADGAPHQIVKKVREWLVPRTDLQAAIWTALPCNLREKTGRDFSTEAAVQYLSELEATRDQAQAMYARAREYVTNAPPLVDTNVRKAMRTRGWTNSSLSPTLFETPPE